MSDYRFRFYCGACSHAGDWFECVDAARAAEREHSDTHDVPLMESTRIQRYPADEVDA